jgi:hypothetical protein
MWPSLVLCFSAGIVVGLDLIQSSQEHLVIDRNFTRGLIQEAMHTLQYISAVHKDVGTKMETILNVLLKEEDDIWTHRSLLSSDPSGSQLKARIISRVQQETIAPNSSRSQFFFRSSNPSITTWPLAGSPFTHPIDINGVQVSSSSSSLLPNPSMNPALVQSSTTSSSDIPSQIPSSDSNNDAGDLYCE